MDDEDGIGIVWLEDGHEVPFEAAGARRPWLEESSDWGSGAAAAVDGDNPDDPPALVWV